jgi:hypothetical protein
MQGATYNGQKQFSPGRQSVCQPLAVVKGNNQLEALCFLNCGRY